MKKLFVYLLILFSMISLGNAALIHEWNFTNGGEDKIGTLDGNLTNGAVNNQTNGFIGKGMYFDGVDDYIDFIVPTDFPTGAGTRTFSMWVKIPVNQTDVYFMSYGQGSALQFWSPNIQTGKDYGLMFYTGDYSSGFYPDLEVWEFQTYVYDGSKLLHYIDGVNVKNHTVAANTQSVRPFVMGARNYNGVNSNYANFYLDEVRVYDNNLNHSQVAELYTNYTSAPAEVDITTNTSRYYGVRNLSIQVNASIQSNISYIFNDTEDFIDDTDLIAYYRAESGYDESNNSIDLQARNSATFGFGKYGKAFEFDGVNQYFNGSGANYTSPGSAYTISLWYYHDSAQSCTSSFAGNGMVALSEDDKPRLFFGCRDTGTEKIRFRYQTSTAGTGDVTSEHALENDAWVHILGIVRDGGSSRCETDLYVNGVLEDSDVDTSCTWENLNGTELMIGYTDNYWQGNLDEIRIYKRELNSSEISEINSTSPYTSIGTNVNTTTVSFTNLADNTYNITWFANTASSAALLSELFSVDVTNPSLNVSNFSEANSYTVNFTERINYTDANIQSCNVNISNGTSYNCSQLITFTENGNHTFNVSVTDFSGNGNSSLNNIILVNPIQYFYFENASGGAISNFEVDGESYVTFYNKSIYDIGLGNQTLIFSKVGYATTNFTRNFNITSTYNETITMPAARIIINVYDRETEAYVTSTTTLSLVANIGQNTTTTNGTAVFQSVDFEPSTFQVIASNPNYQTESVYFDYTNQEELTVDIYLTNSTATITIKVKDSLGFFVEGSIVKALEWKPVQSAYLSVAQCQTNVNGACDLNIELNDKLYKFSATKGTISTTTSSQIITQDGTTLTITLTDSELEVTSSLSTISSSFTETITGNTTTSRLEFVDSAGVSNTYCIKEYKDTGFSQILLNSTCTTSSSGIIFHTTSTNNTYDLVLIADVTVDSIVYPLGKIIHPGIGNLGDSLKDTNLHIFVPIVFGLLGLATGLFFGNIFIATLLMTGFSWFSTLLVPSVISTSSAVGITVIAAFILWGSSKR